MFLFPRGLWKPFRRYINFFTSLEYYVGNILVHARLRSCFSHGQLFVTPMACSLPGSSVDGILQARILEWIALPSSKGSSWPRDLPHASCFQHWQVGSLSVAPPGKHIRSITDENYSHRLKELILFLKNLSLEAVFYFYFKAKDWKRER